MGTSEDTPRAPEKREASTKKQRDWKGWLKREGTQLGSIWVRWWIALMMVGAIDLVFGNRPRLGFPVGLVGISSGLLPYCDDRPRGVVARACIPNSQMGVEEQEGKFLGPTPEHFFIPPHKPNRRGT